ncbi:hypothetical protein TWF569_011162 [Orbilia oligospora]|nr:hypothetical protein TWF103_011804 [Orbilia oligospora]KAF3131539.1 hypothetical protein TWF569_011162 [Orbilia oligospora]KAF3152311.1 hypothetical protein TWF594_004012 [Orbilia oligospora]
MCKLRVTQFTCGHSHEGIEEICGWMKLRPHRAKLQCPYRDPKGTLIKDTSRCRECYFAESEALAQFRDPNITKRVSPKASKALADPVSVGGSARPWSMSKEERRQRIAERYGVYSDRDLPVSDPANEEASLELWGSSTGDSEDLKLRKIRDIAQTQLARVDYDKY